MERITQPTTAVPLDVMRVLDAMTEANWCQFNNLEGVFNDPENAPLCLMHRAHILKLSAMMKNDLWNRCCETYRYTPAQLNDRAASLADLKAKIIALYRE